MKVMKIAVVGGGAMGGALAAEATLAGHGVHVLDVSKSLVERINQEGLEIRGGTDVVTARPAATTDARSVGPVDVVVVFVKAQHTRSAAESLAPLRDEHTIVVSLQNGWGNADVLAEVLGEDRLVFGVTYHSCSSQGPGVVNHSGRGPTYVGSFADTPDAADASRLAAGFLDSSGWPATVTPNVRQEIWKKLILNTATLPTAALTGLTAGALGVHRDMLEVVDAIARETTAVAGSLGLDIDADERIDAIHTVLAGAGGGKASMLQDVEARRKTEIAVINAAVVRAGAATETPTPLNSMMTTLINGLESSWTQ